MQAFLQSLCLEWQETGAQAATSSGFLSSCLTSLCLTTAVSLSWCSPLLLDWSDRLVSLGLSQSTCRQTGITGWLLEEALYLEQAGRELCRHCSSGNPRSGYPMLLVSFVLCACNYEISSPFPPVLKCWKYSAYEDALPVRDCKSVMSEEIFNDIMINMFQWVEKSLK